MITKYDMIKVLRKKDKALKRSNQEEANRLIERCSKEILSGNFSVSPVSTSVDVHALVRKAFNEEGIEVELTVQEVESRSSRKKSFTNRHATYRFSVIEE